MRAIPSPVRPPVRPFIGLLISISLFASQANAANLLDIVTLAQQNDATLKAAEQQRLAVEQNRPIAQSNLRPQIGATAGLSYSRTDVRSGGSPTAPNPIEGTGKNIGISLNQVIYNRIDNINLGIADLQVKQAELAYAAAEQSLLLRTAQSYFTVLKANAALQLAIASQSAFKNQLAQAQKRYEVGLVAVTDVANAQANYDKSNADIINARNALENAQTALSTLIGENPPALDDVQTSLSTPRPSPDQLAAWQTLATRQNLDLQGAEVGGQIKAQQVDLNQAAAAPTVNLTGQYGYNSAPNQVTGTTNNNLAASIGLQVAVPLYTGGRINAQSRQAAFGYQQSQFEIDQLRRTVQQSTANDFRGVLTRISEIKAYEQSVESARTSLAATEAGYQVGTRTIVDVLNAQIQVFSAMANFLNARYDYLTTSLQLKADTGQLTLDDIKAIDTQLSPAKINALIAPLMGNSGSEAPSQQMIERVIERANQTVDPGKPAHKK